MNHLFVSRVKGTQFSTTLEDNMCTDALTFVFKQEYHLDINVLMCCMICVCADDLVLL